MTPIRFLGAFALVLTLVVSMAPAQAAEPNLAGNWYGIGEDGDPDVFYIDSFAADHTFHSEFRKCVKGKMLFHQTETGTWQINNGTLWMSIKTVDERPSPRVDLYKVESLTDKEFKFRLLSTGYLFDQKKVAKFEFPECYLGS